MDALGLIIAVVVTAASVTDNAIGVNLLDKVKAHTPSVTKAWVDSGFKDDVQIHGAVHGIDVEQVKRSDTNVGIVPLLRRWVVDRQRHPDAAPPAGPGVREQAHLIGVTHLVGLDGEPAPPADRHHHRHLARRVTPTANRPSILEVLAERQAATTIAVEQLREQITILTDQLTAAETELAELAITRKTLLSLNGHTDPPPAPADATIASPAYQQILAVFHTATAPMRAEDICHALGTGSTARDTEGLRAKLKRLVARQILTEPEPGRFTLAPPPSPA